MEKKELKKIRKSLGLSSHQQMADLFKISRVAYTRYENGVRKIPPYIEQSLNFFSRLSKREQNKDMKRVRCR